MTSFLDRRNNVNRERRNEAILERRNHVIPERRFNPDLATVRMNPFTSSELTNEWGGKDQMTSPQMTPPKLTSP